MRKKQTLYIIYQSSTVAYFIDFYLQFNFFANNNTSSELI